MTLLQPCNNDFFFFCRTVFLNVVICISIISLLLAEIRKSRFEANLFILVSGHWSVSWMDHHGHCGKKINIKNNQDKSPSPLNTLFFSTLKPSLISFFSGTSEIGQKMLICDIKKVTKLIRSLIRSKNVPTNNLCISFKIN